MSGSLNKAMLVGRLGRDPEVRQTQAGTTMVGLSVATSDSWKDKNTGEKKERTEWHRVVIFNERCAAFASKYLSKGDMVYVEGALQTRKWTTQEGHDRYSTEIVVGQYKGDVQGLVSARGTNEEEPAHGDTREEDAKKTETGQATRKAESSADDEIPF